MVYCSPFKSPQENVSLGSSYIQHFNTTKTDSINFDHGLQIRDILKLEKLSNSSIHVCGKHEEKLEHRKRLQFSPTYKYRIIYVSEDRIVDSLL